MAKAGMAASRYPPAPKTSRRRARVMICRGAQRSRSGRPCPPGRGRSRQPNRRAAPSHPYGQQRAMARWGDGPEWTMAKAGMAASRYPPAPKTSRRRARVMICRGAQRSRSGRPCPPGRGRSRQPNRRAAPSHPYGQQRAMARWGDGPEWTMASSGYSPVPETLRRRTLPASGLGPRLPAAWAAPGSLSPRRAPGTPPPAAGPAASWQSSRGLSHWSLQWLSCCSGCWHATRRERASRPPTSKATTLPLQHRCRYLHSLIPGSSSAASLPLSAASSPPGTRSSR